MTHITTRSAPQFRGDKPSAMNECFAGCAGALVQYGGLCDECTTSPTLCPAEAIDDTQPTCVVEECVLYPNECYPKKCTGNADLHFRSLPALKVAARNWSKTTALTAFQTELLLAMYEQQFRYRSGQWNFDGTIWSRATFRLASNHGALRPSPAAGRKNMSRQFEGRCERANTSNRES